MNDKYIRGICSNCRLDINNDSYVIKEGKIYHDFCYKQILDEQKRNERLTKDVFKVED